MIDIPSAESWKLCPTTAHILSSSVTREFNRSTFQANVFYPKPNIVALTCHDTYYIIYIYMVQYDCVFAAIYNIYTYVVAWNTLIMYSTTSRRLQKGPQNISVLWGSPSRNQRRTNNYDLKQGQLCRCLAEILQMTMTSSVHLFRYQKSEVQRCCVA